MADEERVIYHSNARKDRSDPAAPKQEKEVSKVISGEVVMKKKGLGKKFKEIFVGADARGVTQYVVQDVLVPAIRNVVVDSVTKGVERMMYGETVSRRRGYLPGNGGPRVTYNSPVRRDPRASDMGLRSIPPRAGVREPIRLSKEDIVVASRADADIVLEKLCDIIEQYGTASVADLNELVGFPTSHVDQKWGWNYLIDTPVKQIREGFLIDLPPAEPI